MITELRETDEKDRNHVNDCSRKEPKHPKALSVSFYLLIETVIQESVCGNAEMKDFSLFGHEEKNNGRTTNL